MDSRDTNNSLAKVEVYMFTVSKNPHPKTILIHQKLIARQCLLATMFIAQKFTKPDCPKANSKNHKYASKSLVRHNAATRLKKATGPVLLSLCTASYRVA